ncbi:hypothetical protein CK203_104546 [Vitis vinifera]|uniref:Uncharacterized protein n=1 Tax=Vitis vinifera TaxID=29760 RepID=A0A438FGM9_VITVI|nr:hypothetical protein CK203_104546 [Vitis vinifera]
MYLLYANLSLACLLSLAACKLEFHLKSNSVFQIEKNFFLQGSMSKTMHSTDGKRRENWAMTRRKRVELNMAIGSVEASVKLKSSRDVKKPPKGSTFFDRFKKLSKQRFSNYKPHPRASNTGERFTSSAI